MARIIGCVFVLLGLATLGWDAMSMDYMILLKGNTSQLSSLGDIWQLIHPESLSAVHAVVETHVSAALWDKFLAPVLLYKAVALLSVPGALLAAWPLVLAVLARIAEGHIFF